MATGADGIKRKDGVVFATGPQTIDGKPTFVPVWVGTEVGMQRQSRGARPSQPPVQLHPLTGQVVGRGYEPATWLEPEED